MDSVKSGYVTKCGKTVKSWKKRWFVLKANGFLYYYTDPSCKNEKGHVDIINCAKLAWWSVAEGEKLSDPDMESRTFLIVCSERTYTCVCDTEVECRSWLATLCKVHDGSEPPHYPSPTYPKKSEPPPVAMTTAPPMHAMAPQDCLRPANPPMPQHSPQVPHRGPPMPQPQMPQPPPQQPPPYTQHANTLPRQPYPPPPPPDYRHSFVGPLPPQQPAYYPPPVVQPRYGAPPPQPRYCAPPPQPRPYYPPLANQPGGPYAPKPPVYYSPRPPPAGQFAPRPYVPPPQQPRVTQQQQTNVVVVRL